MNHVQILKLQFCVVCYLPRTQGGIGQETSFNHIPDIKFVQKLFLNSHIMSLLMKNSNEYQNQEHLRLLSYVSTNFPDNPRNSSNETFGLKIKILEFYTQNRARYPIYNETMQSRSLLEGKTTE